MTGTIANGLKNGNSAPLATVAQGQLRGVSLCSRSGRSYAGFLGIPYADEPDRFEVCQKSFEDHHMNLKPCDRE